MEEPAAGVSEVSQQEDDDVGFEVEGRAKQVYLVTLAHPRVERSSDGVELKAPGAFTREQVRDALLQALEATQGSRASPLTFCLMAIFQEKHASGEIHFHIALKACRCFRFAAVKAQLLANFGLASHWSCSHDHYASCVAYGYVPSLKKPQHECDAAPLLWAAPGCSHPPLAEASRPPVTAKATTARRERARCDRAAEGKGEKFKAMDLWPIVVRENISSDLPGGAEKVIAYARRCGGPAMVEWCFNNHQKLDDLIARCWQLEKVEELVAELDKPRVHFVTEAQLKPCVCGGRWRGAADELFHMNGLCSTEWRQAVWKSLEQGRGKGSLVCHAGKEGDEGKSFLLAPFYKIFGDDNIFTAPPKNAFPLLDLPKARVVILDDWRFNEDIISYPLQLLWFEGKPFVIARPQNHFSGHVRYKKDDPVFITTLEDDLMALTKNIMEGDRDMMLKRLKIFRFHRKITNPDRSIPACGRCLADLLLENAEVVLPTSAKRKASPQEHTGLTPERKRFASWSVDEVVMYLDNLGLGHAAAAFRRDAIDGRMLAELCEEDFVGELGLTRLQARKVMDRLRA